MNRTYQQLLVALIVTAVTLLTVNTSSASFNRRKLLRTTGDVTNSDSANPATITDLSFPVEANSTYVFTSRMWVNSGPSTNGAQLGVFGPTGATWVGTVANTNSDSSVTYGPIVTSIGNIVGFTNAASTIAQGFYVVGTIKTDSTAGVCELHLKTETNGTLIRVSAGAVLEYQRVS